MGQRLPLKRRRLLDSKRCPALGTMGSSLLGDRRLPNLQALWPSQQQTPAALSSSNGLH
jgi:hypothetical protein